MEGDTVKINCSGTDSTLTAYWIINGSQFSLRSFRSIPTYSFNLVDNSLVIHNVSRRLDGISYQCVIERQASQIGYLTVITIICHQENNNTVTASSPSTSESDSYFYTVKNSRMMIVGTTTVTVTTSTMSTAYHEGIPWPINCIL